MRQGLGSDRMEDELVRQTTLLADLVGEADPELAVPSCPDWTVGELTVHVGLGHRWATGIIASRASGPVPNSQAPDRHAPGDSARRAQWLRAGAARLAAAVRQAGPEARVWTWADDQTAGFWLRRMAHETVIHRADAALALQRSTEIASDLAVDGITELLQIIPYVLEKPDTVGLLASDRACTCTPSTPGPARPGNGRLPARPMGCCGSTPIGPRMSPSEAAPPTCSCC
jgi:uncharacterized protein (TIGR03083 family)